MHTILNVHGYHFTIQGQGFGAGNAKDGEADFEMVVDFLSRDLASRPNLGELHAAAIFSEGGDPTDDAGFQALARIADKVCLGVLRARSWANPHGASVAISAIPRA